MGKLRQVWRLHAQGVPKLQISTATGLSRNTVRRYLTAFTGLETTWGAIMPLSDKELYEFFRLDPVVDLDTRVGVLHEFLKQNDRKMLQRGMTLGRLYALYTHVHAGGYHKTAFYRHYNLWKHRVPPSMHLQALDVSTDELADVEVFVAILMEIIEDLHGERSTLFASHVPVSKWCEVIGEQTIADAILHRNVSATHSLELKRDSLRKWRDAITPEGTQKQR